MEGVSIFSCANVVDGRDRGGRQRARWIIRIRVMSRLWGFVRTAHDDLIRSHTKGHAMLPYLGWRGKTRTTYVQNGTQSPESIAIPELKWSLIVIVYLVCEQAGSLFELRTVSGRLPADGFACGNLGRCHGVLGIEPRGTALSHIHLQCRGYRV